MPRVSHEHPQVTQDASKVEPANKQVVATPDPYPEVLTANCYRIDPSPLGVVLTLAWRDSPTRGCRQAAKMWIPAGAIGKLVAEHNPPFAAAAAAARAQQPEDAEAAHELAEEVEVPAGQLRIHAANCLGCTISALGAHLLFQWVSPRSIAEPGAVTVPTAAVLEVRCAAGFAAAVWLRLYALAHPQSSGDIESKSRGGQPEDTA